MELLFLGFVMWYATGIDDALIFGGIFAQARTTKMRLHGTLGFLFAFTLMCIVVVFAGTLLSSIFTLTLIGGITVRDVVTVIALLFVIYLGYVAWQGSENVSEESENTNKNLGRQAFMGFLLNCNDDIAVNTANILGRSDIEIWQYMGGVTLGIISMICITWYLQTFWGQFAARYGKVFDRTRACGIWLAAGFIGYPWILSILGR